MCSLLIDSNRRDSEVSASSYLLELHSARARPNPWGSTYYYSLPRCHFDPTLSIFLWSLIHWYHPSFFFLLNSRPQSGRKTRNSWIPHLKSSHRTLPSSRLSFWFWITISYHLEHRTARTVNQTVFLLHKLLLRTEPTNLRYKLQHAPHRPFNGITHMFIVTFGRLGYSDTPEWIDTKSRQELEMVGGASLACNCFLFVHH